MLMWRRKCLFAGKGWFYPSTSCLNITDNFSSCFLYVSLQQTNLPIRVIPCCVPSSAISTPTRAKSAGSCIFALFQMLLIHKMKKYTFWRITKLHKALLLNFDKIKKKKRLQDFNYTSNTEIRRYRVSQNSYAQISRFTEEFQTNILRYGTCGIWV